MPVRFAMRAVTGVCNDPGLWFEDPTATTSTVVVRLLRPLSFLTAGTAVTGRGPTTTTIASSRWLVAVTRGGGWGGWVVGVSHFAVHIDEWWR
jgi:hypothetical protein